MHAPPLSTFLGAKTAGQDAHATRAPVDPSARKTTVLARTVLASASPGGTGQRAPKSYASLLAASMVVAWTARATAKTAGVERLAPDTRATKHVRLTDAASTTTACARVVGPARTAQSPSVPATAAITARAPAMGHVSALATTVAQLVPNATPTTSLDPTATSRVVRTTALNTDSARRAAVTAKQGMWAGHAR